MATWNEGLQEQLECSICLGPFKNPRILTCFHVCCTDCIRGLIKGKKGNIKCPYCKANISVPDTKEAEGFPVAFHINALQEFVKYQNHKKAPIPCHNKQKDPQHSDATVKCLDCNVYYCRSCNNAHNMVAVAEIHEIIPIQDLKEEHFEKAAQKQVTFCQQHPTSPLNFYCKDEKIPVCQRCCIIKHSQHRIVDLVEISSQCREMYRFLPTGYRFDRIITEHEKIKQKAKELLNKDKKAIEERYQKALNKLKLNRESLINIAEANTNSFVRKQDAIIAEAEKKLSLQKKTIGAAGIITSFSPDVAIVEQHEEFENNLTKLAPQIGIQSVGSLQLIGGLLSQGDIKVDMNMEVRDLDVYDMIR